MIWIAKYSQDAEKDLSELGLVETDRILSKVESYCCSDNPLVFAKRLQGQLRDFYRFRVGNYRVIFQHLAGGEVQILSVIKVGLRKDVY